MNECEENMNIMLIHGIYYRANQYNNNIGFRIRYEEIEKICILFVITLRHEAYHKKKDVRLWKEGENTWQME